MATGSNKIPHTEGPISIVPFEKCDQEVASQLSKVLNYQIKEEWNSILKSLMDPLGEE